MGGVLEWLRGKKTYIIVITAFIFNIGVMAGVWALDSQLWEIINYILGFLGIGAVRAGIKKTEV